MNNNTVRFRVANGVCHSLLANADQVMHTAGSERNLLSLDVECGFDLFLAVVRADGTSKRL